MSQSKTVYAGFWLRAAAMVIDALILYLPIALLESTLRNAIMGNASTQAMTASPEAMQTSFLISFAVQALLGLLYFGIVQGIFQATPGKMALGLRVVTTDLQRISVLRSVGRYFAEFLSAVVICLGYLWVAFGERKQGWHDKLAKTYVVKKSSLSSAGTSDLRKAA